MSGCNIQISTVDAKSSINEAVRFALISAVLFSLMFALIKLLGKNYPSGEILFCRSFFALLPIFPALVRAGGLEALKTKRPGQHITRSMMGLISFFLCIEALRLLPLSEATTIFYSAPLVTTLLAAPLLKEKITPRKLAAIATGFLGVLYMMQPKLSSSISGALLALASAICSGFVYIELRKLSRTEKSITIVVYFMTACSLVGLMTMPFQMVLPDLRDAAILLAIGICGGVAQICMTEAYHRAPASTVAPLSYSSLVWAMLFDLLFFTKTPSAAAWVGAAVIAVSGIFVVGDGPKSAEAKQ